MMVSSSAIGREGEGKSNDCDKSFNVISLFLGWWRGQSGNQSGWFPSNYTTEENDNDDGHTYAMAESVLDIVVALYSFNSNNDTELSFEKGDRLEIVDRPPADPEWFKARNQKGQIGLVPRNYLQELQEYLNTPYPRGGPDSLDRRPEMPSSGTSTMQSVSHGNGNSQMERPVLSGKSWYYGAITRNQCDTVLNSHGHDGDFLIRDSETNVSSDSLITRATKANSKLFSF
jgi:NCK adaptor protein 2